MKIVIKSQTKKTVYVEVLFTFEDMRACENTILVPLKRTILCCWIEMKLVVKCYLFGLTYYVYL